MAFGHKDLIGRKTWRLPTAACTTEFGAAVAGILNVPPTKEVMMASTPQDLVGREVYARDGVKIGQIKDLVYGGEYAVVRRSFLSKIVVPVRAIQSSVDRLTIPRTSSFLDNAPQIDPKYELSPKDKAYLDDFYLPKAA